MVRELEPRKHGFLTFFSDAGAGDGGAGDGGGDGGAGGESGTGGGSPEIPDLEELLKNPTFKAQYEAKFKTGMSQRMKKFDGVDVEKYKAWEKAEQERIDGEKTEVEKLQGQLAIAQAKAAATEAKEKAIAVKEHALDNGMNPKLVARLINLDSVKVNESGEFEGIVEAIEAVKAEFPDLFGADNSGGGSGDQSNGGNNGGGTYKHPNQKGNPATPKDPTALGAAIAAQRHGKKE
ncbi:putative minor structural protein 1 [Bacillus phage vB_BceS-M2]